MGYITRPLVSDKFSPHSQVSLSGLSNFLKLDVERSGGEDKGIEIKITVKKSNFTRPTGNGSDEKYLIPQTRFVITEKKDTSQKHTFQGTYDDSRVSDTVFRLVENDKAAVAENIRACLLRNSFFRARFDISIPLQKTEKGLANGETIIIKSLGAGELYEFTFEDEKENPLYDPDFLKIEGDPRHSTNHDPIDAGMGNVDIEAEVYTETGIFLGEDDSPLSRDTLGKHVATMSKAYFGQPIWFDVNALMNVNKTYSDDFLRPSKLPPNAKEEEKEQERIRNIWMNTGTVNDVRLVMKKYNGSSRETFYHSNVLYAVTGYARTLDKIDLDGEYVFEYEAKTKKLIKPLTTQPALPHIKGQVQYFNFLFKDPDHNLKGHENDFRLGIRYDVYTQSGKFMLRVVPEESFVPKGKCFMANNILLDIDKVVVQAEKEYAEKMQIPEEYVKAGIVKVSLCCNNRQSSYPLEFRILPECLYKVNDFAFLNSLGGWSSFSFGGESITDSKASANTIYSNHIPGHTVSSRIESVFDKEIKETYSVKTLPVDASVAEWLREIASSVAVYELSTRRYIIVDDFNIKHNTTDNLFTFEMKYHYSDTYNAVIK